MLRSVTVPVYSILINIHVGKIKKKTKYSEVIISYHTTDRLLLRRKKSAYHTIYLSCINPCELLWNTAFLCDWMRLFIASVTLILGSVWNFIWHAKCFRPLRHLWTKYFSLTLQKCEKQVFYWECVCVCVYAHMSVCVCVCTQSVFVCSQVD